MAGTAAAGVAGTGAGAGATAAAAAAATAAAAAAPSTAVVVPSAAFGVAGGLFALGSGSLRRAHPVADVLSAVCPMGGGCWCRACVAHVGGRQGELVGWWVGGCASALCACGFNRRKVEMTPEPFPSSSELNGRCLFENGF